MPGAPPTDVELVTRCLAGDQSAWASFVERFSRYVLAITARGYGLAEHDAEDVFQEVFARAYERLGELRDPAAVQPWIAQLTRNACVDRIRGARRATPMGDLPDVPDEDETFARLDLSLDLHRALATLPEHCAEVLDRFFARDESYHVIGEAMGLPAGTIASRISRCLAKLKSELAGRSELARASRR
jgi:RNA polymerase sigma-70 factor (ECF subfamily)